MKIKTKLRLGFGFLFAVVLFFGALSLFYINEISKSAEIILKDNYESLRYTREMRKVLDEQPLPLSNSAFKTFENSLIKEEVNITEHGEQNEVVALRKAFTLLTSAQNKPDAEREVRRRLQNIDDVNMRAIVRKNITAQNSVKQAVMLLGFAGTITFLILFSFCVNFPGFVANPLRQLLNGIKEISKGNYGQRLEFSNNDEFAEVANAFNQMAAKLNDWESSNLANIMSEKKRIEAIIEQMQDAIIGINEKEEILFINTVAASILNLNNLQASGMSLKELSTKNDLLGHIIKAGPADKPLKIYADGKESYFQLEKSEIIIPNYEKPVESSVIRTGRSAGEVIILKNITTFKELDEAKTNFIATVSHELKTPISAIKMSLKLLTDERVGKLNSEQAGLVEQIKEDSSRLLKITGELLDLSQVETGNIQLNFVPANPNEIINYAVNAVQFQAEQKHIQLEVIGSDDMPKVNADIEKTAWVLINFLSNALRYSPERSKIIIKTTVINSTVEFSVRDFGKGIDEQYRQKLFERYFRVPTDGNNKAGSGLGLAISKDFIEAQNGSIGVESAIGEGSRFYFNLPVQR
ncbi:HAMP domain-containing protein [Mucilaginibacter limnophilus]|uniref:histidine kinase n=1 Tax=Mucilaginibacter limnophilus TaxID=1932778 RepID=A0A437MSN8_9SPHI|nr:ATP-binding protein [Mucilaginibacter limnophilus]RVU00675.1 HAMP domain-containing protein [Mucilaginibacter limnophilus]